MDATRHFDMMNKPKKLAPHGVVNPNRCVRACFASDFVVRFTKSRPKVWKHIQCPINPALKLLELVEGFSGTTYGKSSASVDQLGPLYCGHYDRHCVRIHLETNNRDRRAADLLLFVMWQVNFIPQLEKVDLIRGQEGFVLVVEFKIPCDAEEEMIINITLQCTQGPFENSNPQY